MENSNFDETEGVEESRALRLELEVDQENLVNLLKALTEAGVDFKLKKVEEVQEPREQQPQPYVYIPTPFWSTPYVAPYQFYTIPNSEWPNGPSSVTVGEGSTTGGTTTDKVTIAPEGVRVPWSYTCGDIGGQSPEDVELSLLKFQTFSEDLLYGIGLPTDEAEEIALRLRDAKELQGTGLSAKEEEDLIVSRAKRRNKGWKQNKSEKRAKKVA